MRSTPTTATITAQVSYLLLQGVLQIVLSCFTLYPSVLEHEAGRTKIRWRGFHWRRSDRVTRVWPCWKITLTWSKLRSNKVLVTRYTTFPTASFPLPQSLDAEPNRFDIQLDIFFLLFFSLTLIVKMCVVVLVRCLKSKNFQVSNWLI